MTAIQNTGVIAIDFDGTLALPGQMVSTRVHAALSRIREIGVRVVIVTGRCFAEAERMSRALSPDGLVAENGALVLASGRRVSLAPPEWERVRGTLLAHFPAGCEEIIVSISREELGRAEGLIDRSLASVELNKDRAMILPRGVDKARGFSACLELLKLRSPRLYCVGDGENDLSLFRMCGVRVALENSVESLKAIANYVSAKPNGEGVAEALAALFPDWR